MVRSEASTPAAYLAELPSDRRAVIEAVRRVILDNLRDGIVEGMEFGMISYHLPLEDFPDTYNGHPLGIAALASQKRHTALYLMGIYADPDEKAWFVDAWEATGTKLDMGASCVRFTNGDGVALDVIGEAIARVAPIDVMAAHDAAHGAGPDR